jgi:hypothetical protein
MREITRKTLKKLKQSSVIVISSNIVHSIYEDEAFSRAASMIFVASS